MMHDIRFQLDTTHLAVFETMVDYSMERANAALNSTPKTPYEYFIQNQIDVCKEIKKAIEETNWQ